MRRSYHGLDLYLDDDLIATKAKVVYDNARGVLAVSERGPRGRWAETRVFEGVTGLAHSKVGREMVYTWTGAVTVTGVKAGCGCGGKR